MPKKSTEQNKGVVKSNQNKKSISKSLNPKKTTLLVDNGVETTIPPLLEQKSVTIPSRPSRNRKQRQLPIEECIEAEKTKPWINGFEETYIKLAPGQESNKFSDEIIDIKIDSEWYKPKELFYKIMCKESSVYSASQSGSTITINKVSNKIPLLLTVANKINFGSKSYIILENNEYKTARLNYFKNKYQHDQDVIVTLLSTKFSKIGQLMPAVKHKVNKYVELFNSKIPNKWLEDLVTNIFQKVKDNNNTVEQLLEMIVNSTVFFRNEFDILNKNLLMQIDKNIILPQQILLMSSFEILPELFQNIELKNQLQQPELVRKINSLKKSIIQNIASNIIIYQQILEQKKFKTQISLPHLQPTIETEKEIIKEDPINLSIDDIIPIHKLKTVDMQHEHGNTPTVDDLDRLGELVFYKDQDGIIYCFDLKEIKYFVDNEIESNPLSGKKFLPEFLQMIKKLNLTRVFPSGYLEPWKPRTKGQELLFGSASDIDDEEQVNIQDVELIDIDTYTKSESKTKNNQDTSNLLDTETEVSIQDSDTPVSEKYTIIGTEFIDYIDQYIEKLETTISKHSFETISKDLKENIQESRRNYYCKACSKRLDDPSTWTRTINIDKKSEDFVSNTYHIKCLYNAPFKI